MIDYDHKGVLESLSRYSQFDTEKVGKLLNIDNSGILSDYRCGLINTKEFYDGLTALIKLRNLSLEAFKNIWCSQFTLNKAIEEWILNDILGKYNSIIATDTIPIHFKYLLSEYEILRKFDKRYASCELKMVKTNQEFFKTIINENKLDGSKCIFIDDLEKNVQTSIKAGMIGIVFDPKTIKSKFNEKIAKLKLN